MQLLDILTSPWAIELPKLREIQAIYAAHLRGEKIDVDAVEARLQRPLANEQQEYRIQDGVAVLSLEGVIAPKANLFTRISGGVSTQLAQKQVESAIADPRVRALVLQIDSPGGSIFGTPELATSILELSSEKPIVAVSDAVMASAAYWIGSAANAVYITGRTVQVGSIGVVATHNYNPRVAEGTTEITAGRYKRIASDTAPLTEEGRAYLQERVDHIYTVFVDAVAQHRGVTVEQVLEHMADGRVFVGQQAIDAGLVDGVSTVDALVEQLADNPEAFSKRRRTALRGASGPAAQGAGVAQDPPNPPTSITGFQMDIEKLKAEHGSVYQAVLALGIAQGADAERARIQAVEAALIPGHEALIASLKFDGKTTGGDAALAVNAAERQIRQAQGKANTEAAPKPVAQVPAPTVPADAAAKDAAEQQRLAAMPIDERCKAEWDANAEIRGEFGTLSAYTAFAKASAAGKVRVLKQRASA
ncbi:S49 family peptidase [Ramlibacter sp. Leaf400]|uniref:S49 family peptidase n=1 Tax=Ramlibacter sp. Leaf400 TaxID=1736365 RepID=UPI0006FC3630|nr:S49 family peptidase [Ramlibacter sp. Leaf400]KQT10972.1 Clp protease ClpP [Ramlibacter sp. Leaf400]